MYFNASKSWGFKPAVNPTTFFGLELTGTPAGQTPKELMIGGNGHPKKVVSLVRESATPQNGAPQLFLVGSRIDISKKSCPDEY